MPTLATSPQPATLDLYGDLPQYAKFFEGKPLECDPGALMLERLDEVTLNNFYLRWPGSYHRDRNTGKYASVRDEWLNLKRYHLQATVSDCIRGFDGYSHKFLEGTWSEFYAHVDEAIAQVGIEPRTCQLVIERLSIVDPTNHEDQIFISQYLAVYNLLRSWGYSEMDLTC